MPTAGRLLAAIGLAGVAWFATDIVIAIWPDDYNFGRFRYFCTALAFGIGWRVIGVRLGRGLLQGAGAGLTGMAALLFWIFLLLAFYEMIGRSLDSRYTGPFEAIKGMFEIAYGWLLNILFLPLGLFLAGGSMVVGFVSELVSKKVK
jgi:hypothetical protein